MEAGYAFDEPALEIGALVVDGPTHPDAPVRIPLSMLNLNGEYISIEATGGKIVDPTKVAMTLGGTCSTSVRTGSSGQDRSCDCTPGLGTTRR